MSEQSNTFGSHSECNDHWARLTKTSPLPGHSRPLANRFSCLWRWNIPLCCRCMEFEDFEIRRYLLIHDVFLASRRRRFLESRPDLGGRPSTSGVPA